MTISDRCSRRTFLRGTAAIATVTSASGSGCLHLMGIRQRQQRRRERLSENPISFVSQRARIKKEDAGIVAHNSSQLIDAVGKSGTTVWIPEDATIDMTGESMVQIAHNVTIASNRNLDDGKGGLIKTNDQRNFAVFITKNEGVHFRVTGVRLKGPRTDYFDPVDQGRNLYDYAVTGFRAYGKSLIVDHCEVMGWTNAAFVPGTGQTTTQGWFHHNEMHHNQMAHLGYPMDLYNGEHLIEWNYFDHNRHSIAGFGYPTNGYEARFNVVGPNAILHAFDMHNLGENLPRLREPDLGRVSNGKSEGRPSQRNIEKNEQGGKYINIHHNVFELTSHPAFSVQGIPEQHMRFAYNWCARSDNKNVVLYPPAAVARVQKNVFEADVISQGRSWLTNLSQQLTQMDLLTRPSPGPLPIDLPIETSPSLSNSTKNGTQPSTPMNSTQTSPGNAYINTGMSLTRR